MYRFPSQSKGDFETFKGKLELTLDKIFVNNPVLVSALGDFIPKPDQQYKYDKIANLGIIKKQMST